MVNHMTLCTIYSEQLYVSRINSEKPKLSNVYWDSNLAQQPFILLKDESVTEFLAQRADVDDDDVLVCLVWDIDNHRISNKRKLICNKCLYLRKVYELALQHLNTLSWKDCCRVCVIELADARIHFIKNEKNIWRWYISVRHNEMFSIPNL